MLYAHNLSTLTALPTELRIQYVHYDPGICSTWRNRKYPRFYHCSSDLNLLTGVIERTERLPYVDLLLFVLIAMMLFNWAPGARVFRERMKSKLKNDKGGSIRWHY